MDQGTAAALGFLMLILLLLGIWKLLEIAHYAYLKLFKTKDLRIRKKIRKAKEA